MGNNLSATAPSQILSVDSYLGDATDYQFVKSLGSTRFMKVARVKHEEGYAVVKVFAVRDPSLSLSSYKTEVEKIRSKLKHASNCLPFQTIMLTDKAALLFRQYVKHNLYDRISTRPFYNSIERKWVAFQLLCALNQMAKLEICHGDIKSENIMITSWNWLLLTDFASYKPIQVPDDNPADFNYFFDTSRRRICYIAPERFLDSNIEMIDASETTLLPSMDIFSAGCVIAELFTDGTPPFDFSQLLAFREGKYYPSSCLSKIDDPDIKSLIEHMIQRQPNKRYTAEQYLSKWKGKAFPIEFYTHLKKYLGRFCEPPLLSADQTINLLHADLPATVRGLPDWETPESLIMVAAIALSCLRRLRYCFCKLRAIEIVTELAKHLTSHDILERHFETAEEVVSDEVLLVYWGTQSEFCLVIIIPYLMEMVRDKMPRVRASAFQALSGCVTFVKAVPPSEVNIFPEFIFPGSAHLTRDNAVFVRGLSLSFGRQTFASHIALLAETALKFLNASNFDNSNPEATGKDTLTQGYDVQLESIHDTMQETVQALFSDPDSTVRQCLLRNSVEKLCTFFGRSKCNDVILSHMITFLNDKHDWQLRSAFFDSLVWVSSYVGWQSSVLLKPLLEQGLNDSEEYVICKTLDTLASLTTAGLLSKHLALKLLDEAIPLLQHPCKWIRFNTIGFISASSKKLSLIDLHCHVLPKLKSYLMTPIIQGMDGEEEEKILNLRDFLKRQSRHRSTVAGITAANVDGVHSKITQFGHIDVGMVVKPSGESLLRRHADLVKNSTDSLPKQSKKTPARNKNQEGFVQLEGVTTPQIKQAKAKMPPMQLKYTHCKLNLRDLVHRQRDLHEADVKRRALEEDRHETASEVWRPRGILVGHMLEHRGSVNRIAVSPSSEHFATVSSDTTLKLWDCEKLSGKGVINQSKCTWDKSGQKLLCCAFHGDEQVVCAGAKGDVHCVDMKTMTDIFSGDSNAGSSVMDITPFHRSSLVSYITAHGDINILDLRDNKPVCTLSHNLHNGLMTCLVVDPKQHWLCVATDKGKHICWDLRFRLPVTQVQHQHLAAVRRMAIHPLRPSSIISAVSGNNEVNVWDLETSSCTTTLWASTVPVMLPRQRTQDSVNGLLVTRQSNDINIITAGTDSAIRLWDIRDPPNSKILSSRPMAGGGVVYEVKRVEGADVIQEHAAKKKGTSGPSVEGAQETRSGSIETCHHNIITDIATFKVSQNLLVTASTSGVVKLWK